MALGTLGVALSYSLFCRESHCVHELWVSYTVSGMILLAVGVYVLTCALQSRLESSHFADHDAVQRQNLGTRCLHTAAVR